MRERAKTLARTKMRGVGERGGGGEKESQFSRALSSAILAFSTLDDLPKEKGGLLA